MAMKLPRLIPVSIKGSSFVLKFPELLSDFQLLWLRCQKRAVPESESQTHFHRTWQTSNCTALQNPKQLVLINLKKKKKKPCCCKFVWGKKNRLSINSQVRGSRSDRPDLSTLMRSVFSHFLSLFLIVFSFLLYNRSLRGGKGTENTSH